VIGKTIAQIPEVADTVRAALKKKGRKQATINNYMCVLKATARFCWEKQWQENLSNRIALPDPNNKRHRYLDGVSEVKRLMAKMESPEGKAWVAILASTGLRANELLSVGNVEGCYVRDNIIYLPPQETKGKEPRAFPVAKLGVPYLKFLPIQRNYWSMYWEVKKACKAAGITNFKQHDVRHTYASLLVDKDVDLYVVGALLGHKCAQTTARYAHLKVDKLKQAVAKLAA
jgi:integrase